MQAALALANPGPSATTQIWVADGTDYPDEGGVDSDNDRNATFSLKDRVAIYGGFAGTETLLSQRNPVAKVTILSGDLDQSGTFTNVDAFQVVRSNANTSLGQQHWGIQQ